MPIFDDGRQKVRAGKEILAQGVYGGQTTISPGRVDHEKGSWPAHWHVNS